MKSVLFEDAHFFGVGGASVQIRYPHLWGGSISYFADWTSISRARLVRAGQFHAKNWSKQLKFGFLVREKLVFWLGGSWIGFSDPTCGG